MGTVKGGQKKEGKGGRRRTVGNHDGAAGS